MPFSYDAEVGAGLAALFAAAGDAPLPPVGDVATRRKNVEALQSAIHGLLPMPGDVAIRDFATTTGDSASLLLRWYSKEGAAPGPAVLYAHGGGMILSNVPIYDGPIARYVSARTCRSSRSSTATRPSSPRRHR